MEALVQLGMVSDVLPSDAQISETSVSEAKDYFVTRDGVRFAGTHLIIDLWGATNLSDPEHVDAVLREAAIATGATILHGHFHHFGPNSGVSGVLVLAESHVSVHTWPERDYAALGAEFAPRLAGGPLAEPFVALTADTPRSLADLPRLQRELQLFRSFPARLEPLRAAGLATR